MAERSGQRFYPGRAPIDAYGDGGFRFAGMSHRGSLLILPSGMHAWPPTSITEIESGSFALVFAEQAPIGLLLHGTGPSQVFPSADIRRDFVSHKITLEAMDTGAAVRTYNVLLAEGRDVAAALIAV
ncbi:MAG: MTH938/NDUFAF3 family protein [Aestuariivirgaceae bacterium]